MVLALQRYDGEEITVLFDEHGTVSCSCQSFCNAVFCCRRQTVDVNPAEIGTVGEGIERRSRVRASPGTSRS